MKAIALFAAFATAPALFGQAPTITSINPDTAVAGSSGFVMTVFGTNFVNGSTVYWNNTALIVNWLINDAIDGRHACYLAYSAPSNTLYLVDGTRATRGERSPGRWRWRAAAIRFKTGSVKSRHLGRRRRRAGMR